MPRLVLRVCFLPQGNLLLMKWTMTQRTAATPLQAMVAVLMLPVNLLLMKWTMAQRTAATPLQAMVAVLMLLTYFLPCRMLRQRSLAFRVMTKVAMIQAARIGI